MTTALEEPGAPTGQTVDFDLAGVVGVRLIGASPDDISAARRGLGRYERTLTREPDITVRFTENLVTEPLTFLGLNAMAFNTEGFYTLDSINGAPVARIPFEQIGDRCEFLCRRNCGTIPLLSDAIRFTFLRRHFVPLHASAFRYNRQGILVMGWAKGGKTEMLLAFASNGAEYIGDEWIMVSGDGDRMIGFPVPVAMRDWQLPYISDLVPRIGIQRKVLFGGVHAFEWMHKMLGRSWFKKSATMELFDRALPKIREQNKFKLRPETIFPKLAPDLEGSIDKVFLVMGHDLSDITVESCDGRELACRMSHSNAAEHLRFREFYEAFLYAFPDRRNPFLDQSDELQGRILRQALTGKDSYEVKHPYPFSLPALFEKVEPFC